MIARLWHRVDERLESGHIRFAALSLLGLTAILAVVSFATAERNRTVFGPPLGADFAGFYTAGTIWNRHGAAHLYDGPLQDAAYHDLLPAVSPDEMLPFVHPPFVALPFRLLALLPYPTAFAVWLLISAWLFLAGLALIRPVLPSFSDRSWAVVVLLALSFEPAVMECWLGGQLSAVGFFFTALALYFWERQRPIAAGAALGLLLYKPTLLVLLLPMLVVARQFRMLVGFGISALGLSVLSLATVGPQGCVIFLHKLLGFAETTGGHGLQLRAWKYVDLNSFLRLLLGSHPPINAVILLLLTVAPLALLATMWWRWDRLDMNRRRLIWTATITGTLVFNLYVGVYDSILCILGVLLTADVLARWEKAGNLTVPFRFCLSLLYLTPWLTQPLARLTHVQAYTLVLAVLTLYPLLLARRAEPVPAEVKAG